MSQGLTRGITPPVPAPRRVRQEVRDSLAVIAFSAVASCGMAVVLALAVRFGN